MMRWCGRPFVGALLRREQKPANFVKDQPLPLALELQKQFPSNAGGFPRRAQIVASIGKVIGVAHARIDPWRRVLGWSLVAAMMAWLAWRLSQIGWSAVARELPTSPAFYALILAAYFALPLADALIYRRLWGIPIARSIAMLMRKRVYNSVLVGYSGEAALLVWARGRTSRNNTAILHAIKDVNILSAVVSGCAATLLIAWLATRTTLDQLPTGALTWWGVATIAIAAILPLVLVARRGVLLMALPDVIAVLAIHALRFGLGLILLAAQWWVVMPDASATALLLLLAVYVLVGRIPFVPNRDMLFVVAALAVCGRLAIDPASLAGILVASGSIQQALHLVAFALAAAMPKDWR